MNEADDLPQKICKDCFHKVLAACEIKAKCIETDKLLRQTLKDETPETSIKLEVEEAGNVEGDVEAEVVTDQAASWYESSKKELVISDSVEAPIRKRRRKQDESAHRKRQPKAHDFQCFICNKIFDRIGLKQDHIRKEHAALGACKICNKKRKSALAIEICIKEHKFGQEFLCQVRFISLMVSSIITDWSFSMILGLRQNIPLQSWSPLPSSNLSHRKGIFCLRPLRASNKVQRKSSPPYDVPSRRCIQKIQLSTRRDLPQHELHNEGESQYPHVSCPQCCGTSQLHNVHSWLHLRVRAKSSFKILWW